MMKPNVLTYSCDIFELQASFENVMAKNDFDKYIHGYDKARTKAYIDYRGMPCIKYEFDANNGITICGSSFEEMLIIISDYNDIINKYGVGNTKFDKIFTTFTDYLKKEIVAERNAVVNANEGDIPTITW